MGATFHEAKGFALRRRTSICQKLPEEFDHKLVEFQRFVIDLRQERGYMMGEMGNADETPVWFVMPSNAPVAEKGAKQVKLLTTGNEHSRFTVTADGRKPPLSSYSRGRLCPRRTSLMTILRCNEKGFMNESLMLEWIRLVWNRRPGALFQRPNMLVLDSFRGHLTASVKRALCDGKTDLVVIPGGLTSVLQPLDVACANFTSGLWASTRRPPLAGCNDRRFQQCQLGVVGVEVAPRGNGCQIIQKVLHKQRDGRHG